MYVGQVCLFAFNYSPKGYMLCDGKMLDIIEHPELFALLGSKFGGDGRETFCIPKLPPVPSQYGTEMKYYICISGTYPART